MPGAAEETVLLPGTLSLEATDISQYDPVQSTVDVVAVVAFVDWPNVFGTPPQQFEVQVIDCASFTGYSIEWDNNSIDLVREITINTGDQDFAFNTDGLADCCIHYMQVFRRTSLTPGSDPCDEPAGDSSSGAYELYTDASPTITVSQPVG